MNELNWRDCSNKRQIIQTPADVFKDPTEGDNPTLGLILCSDKNDAVVKYTR
jgi:hypothetical protein